MHLGQSPSSKMSAEARRSKRWVKDLSRKNREHHPYSWFRPTYIDPALQFLRESTRGQDISNFSKERNAWVVKIPPTFSFLGDPGAVLDVLQSILAVSVKGKRFFGLHLDHSSCTDIDLGASAVLDVITMLLRTEWRQRRHQYTLGGQLPDDLRTMGILLCTGVTRNLGLQHMVPPRSILDSVATFRLFHGFAAKNIRGSQDQEVAASDLARHLDRCFIRAASRTFTPEGKRLVVKWAGELITNAEEHSGRGDWYTTAYMAPIDRNTPQEGIEDAIGECRLTVFNFGRSIYQSLSDSQTPEATRDQIRAIARRHLERRIWESRLDYTEEDLWTLIALQEGISCRTKPGESDRGSGTVAMISAFQELGCSVDAEKKPEMVLISGSTRILFDERYKMRQDPTGAGGRMILAFNERNDLNERPDHRNVHSIRGFFPGTLLSMHFFIDRAFLNRHRPNGD